MEKLIKKIEFNKKNNNILIWKYPVDAFNCSLYNLLIIMMITINFFFQCYNCIVIIEWIINVNSNFSNFFILLVLFLNCLWIVMHDIVNLSACAELYTY